MQQIIKFFTILFLGFFSKTGILSNSLYEKLKFYLIQKFIDFINSNINSNEIFLLIILNGKSCLNLFELHK